MTGSRLAWEITFAVLCILLGMLICWPVASWHALKRAGEDAEDARDAAVIAGWKGLADADPDPAPLPVQPVVPHAGPGKHRHPAGPRHAELPVAGYLPAPEPDPWRYGGQWGGTITVPAPVQRPPWEARPPEPEPEPPTEVLEPTAADCLPRDALTDSAFTRRMALDMDRRIAEQEADTERFMAELISATDPILKAITGGAR